jgi:hypothetical protein
LKILYHTKLVNYILEEIQENLLTSSSTAKEVSATTELLQAGQFTADSWRRRSARTIQNCSARCDFRHSDLEMPNKADGENDIIMEMCNIVNYNELTRINNSFQYYNENEDYEEAIVEQTAAKHQKTSEDQESYEDDMTEH